MQETEQYDHVYTIGIVGLGPKGLYGLERLLAQIKSMRLEHPIHVHIFNSNGFFGAGDVYRCDQPSYLIMNYANQNIDMWTNEVPSAILEDTPCFMEWLSTRSGVPTAQIKNGFASRAMVGSYLMDGFTRLCQNLPKNVSIIPYTAIIADIKKRRVGYVLKTQKAGYFTERFQKILLTTGHAWNGAVFEKARKPVPYIDFIYPTDKNLSHIPKNARIAIKGMGLTFIDAVLALTEGRGGTFKSDSNGKYIYIASGSEPGKIVPFSRTGIPMIPRNGVADDTISPYYLTEEVLKENVFITPVSFSETVLPLIKKEFRFNYYRVLFKKRKRKLLFDDDFSVVQEQIDSFHKAYPKDAKFDWEVIEKPFAANTYLTHEKVVDYIWRLIRQARQGTLESPFMAAVGSWRKISAVFNKIYSYGGLDAASHQLFDSYYCGFFNRIAYGPPIENMKKILALAECGIVDFNFAKNAKTTFSKQSNSFRISLQDENESMSIDYLIDGRIPKGNPAGRLSTLFSNLLKKGTLRFYENVDDSNYTPGCVDIDYKGRPLNINGNVNNDLTFYGTPTEGIVFDNDTLSRKRNNFASQWAFDVAVDIQKKHKNIQEKNSDYEVLQR